MRPIPTRIHGGVDYLTALLLVASPWLFNFVRYGAETWVPLVLGAGIVVYSLCTNYECGLAPLLPMPWHLVLDAGGGLFLAASPWLLGFHD